MNLFYKESKTKKKKKILLFIFFGGGAGGGGVEKGWGEGGAGSVNFFKRIQI